MAGSAATPTVNDAAFLNDETKYTVTLTSDAQAAWVFVWSAKLVLNGYTLSVGGDLSNPSSGIFGAYSSGKSPEIDISNSKLVITTPTSAMRNPLQLTDPGLTFTSTNSSIEINVNRIGTSGANIISAGSLAFNDVIINIGPSDTRQGRINITGSPTFRSLIIQSKNSAAHTVNFDSGATITTNKLVAIGSSSSNKLTVKPLSGSSTIALSSGGSSYGQFVDMQASASGAGVPKYIGVNSTQSSGMGWLLQDPPKISTLVDHFDTLNTATWSTVTGGTGNVSVSGGKLNMSWFGGSSSSVDITTKDTYDLINETAYIKVDSNALGLWLTVWPVYQGSDTSIWAATEVTFDERFYRISATSAGVVTIDKYDGSWTNLTTETVSPEQLRSVRLDISGSRNMSDGEMVIDSVGVGPYLAPSNPGAFLQFFGGL